jgi:peroxiredoxin
VSPSTGWAVLHLFCKVRPDTPVDAEAVRAAVKSITSEDHQVVTFAVLGHKADVGFLAVGPDLWRLRALQTALAHAGLDVVDSYVSLTETSEYAKGMPQERIGCTPSSRPRASPRCASIPCLSAATSVRTGTPRRTRSGSG